MTATAISYAVEETFPAQGYIVRTETVITERGSDVTPVAGEGERVASGQVIAVEYLSREALETASELRSLRLRIAQLEASGGRGEAARLESVNSQYGTWILASEETVKQTGDALLYRKLDRVRVVGINEPVRLCELIDMADAADDQNKQLVTIFHQALDCFEKRDWKQAVKGFSEALALKPGDVPSTLYLDRLKQFANNMPSENWDGVYNLTSK